MTVSPGARSEWALLKEVAEGDSVAAKHSAALYLTLLILVVLAIGESSVILLALSLHRY